MNTSQQNINKKKADDGLRSENCNVAISVCQSRTPTLGQNGKKATIWKILIEMKEFMNIYNNLKESICKCRQLKWTLMGGFGVEINRALERVSPFLLTSKKLTSKESKAAL